MKSQIFIFLGYFISSTRITGQNSFQAHYKFYRVLRIFFFSDFICMIHMQDVKKSSLQDRKIIPDTTREVKFDMNADIRLAISFVCTWLVFKLHWCLWWSDLVMKRNGSLNYKHLLARILSTSTMSSPQLRRQCFLLVLTWWWRNLYDILAIEFVEVLPLHRILVEWTIAICCAKGNVVDIIEKENKMVLN